MWFLHVTNRRLNWSKEEKAHDEYDEVAVIVA